MAAARFELLKAKDMAPRNQIVAVELAEIGAEIGWPAGVTHDYSEVQWRLTRNTGERARATVHHRLQVAQQRMSDKDYAGAVDELRLAALGIKIKNDIDWGELSAQVQDALDQAQHAYDAQIRERKTSEARTPK